MGIELYPHFSSILLWNYTEMIAMYSILYSMKFIFHPISK